MTPARRSPSTRTLGSQLVAMSTVLALIERMLRTASRPKPAIETRRNATTVMIFARIENFASIMSSLLMLSAPAHAVAAASKQTASSGFVNRGLRKITEDKKIAWLSEFARTQRM